MRLGQSYSARLREQGLRRRVGSQPSSSPSSLRVVATAEWPTAQAGCAPCRRCTLAQVAETRVEEMKSKVVVYPTPPEPGVERAVDLTYRVVDGASMTLDVYRPARTTEKLPAAVFIHGDLAEPELVRDIKDWGQYRSWGELTASTGIAAVTVNHRSAHQGTRMRDVTEDIEAALDYIDSNGEQLGIDASRLALVAFSMGVPYALRVAFDRRARLRCVVAFYGPMDLSDAPWSVSAELLREFSPPSPPAQRGGAATAARGTRGRRSSAPERIDRQVRG